jgi:hypothetical protein
MNAPAHRPTPPNRLRSSLAVLGAALAAAFVLFAGCGLSTGGIPAEDGGAP